MWPCTGDEIYEVSLRYLTVDRDIGTAAGAPLQLK